MDAGNEKERVSARSVTTKGPALPRRSRAQGNVLRCPPLRGELSLQETSLTVESRNLAGPTLIIITGPSHSGKTSLARALRREVLPEPALVELDNLLENVLFASAATLPVWLPLAHEVGRSMVESILRSQRSVIFESTFTLVDGPDVRLYDDVLQRLIETASSLKARIVVVHLSLRRETALARQRMTGRLSQDIVARIWQAHDRSAGGGLGCASSASVLLVEAEGDLPTSELLSLVCG